MPITSNYTTVLELQMNALVLQTVEETSGEVRKPVLDFHALLVLFFEMCSTMMMDLI